MPIKSPSYQKKISFKENFYKNKFELKGRELFHHLERHPDDKKAKGQLQYIRDALKRDSSELPTLWQKWERDNFFDYLSISPKQGDKYKRRN